MSQHDYESAAHLLSMIPKTNISTSRQPGQVLTNGWQDGMSSTRLDGFGVRMDPTDLVDHNRQDFIELSSATTTSHRSLSPLHLKNDICAVDSFS